MRTIDYLKDHVRVSIINDVRDIALYHSRHYKGKQAGFFGVPRQVFCYIDYLGYVAYGGKNKNTINAVNFIEEFFPGIYKDYAGLLYSMWRHGTVHQYEPKSYFATFENSREMVVSVRWLSCNDSKQENRKEHMKFYSMENRNRDIILVINTCQLVDDLILALDKFIEKLKNSKNSLIQFEDRIDECGGIRSFVEIENKTIRLIVGEQIKLAWNNRSGEINSKGNVISRL